MKTKSIFFMLSFLLIVASTPNVQATPLMTMGGTKNVGVYVVDDLSDPGDSWNGTDGYASNDFTGLYIGTITNDNNDDIADLTALFNYYLGVTDTYNISKIDAPLTSWSGSGFNITYNSGNQSGTWTTTNGEGVNFYSVKAGTGYALYYLASPLMTGNWVTRHLEVGNVNNPNTPTISHLSVSYTEGDPPAPVPEPATMLLFGTGLAGLAGVVRRKKND